MNYRSYPGKVFVVESSLAYIRNEQLEVEVYKAGEALPPGKNVGDIKLIPQRAEVRVIDFKVGAERHVYVLVVNNGSGEQFGWTSAKNLVGGFANETVGLAPSTWALEPLGDNMTCVNDNALIRDGAPTFASRGTTIPVRSFVAVTERSPDGVFVKVSNMTVAQNAVQLGEEIGWTKATNLKDGCADLYFSAAWKDDQGPNGCWRQGSPIGQKLLVNIAGSGAQMEQITLDSLEPYLRLKAAAEEDNIPLSIISAFRTYAHQVELWNLYQSGEGHKAAEPGSSHHQHGQAFDLNTLENVFNGTDRIYEWLKHNAPQHGFIRTVSNESWHWEYRPAEAATLAAQGKFKLSGVNP
jgi:hypothetical protein